MKIYLIEAIGTGRFKIGYAKRPTKRLISLAVGSPFPLRLVHCVPGNGEIEKLCHRILEPHRIHGEWFALPSRTCTKHAFKLIVSIAHERRRLVRLSERLSFIESKLYRRVGNDDRWNYLMSPGTVTGLQNNAPIETQEQSLDEPFLGKGEVVRSIRTGSTTENPAKYEVLARCSHQQHGQERGMYRSETRP